MLLVIGINDRKSKKIIITLIIYYQHIIILPYIILCYVLLYYNMLHVYTTSDKIRLAFLLLSVLFCFCLSITFVSPSKTLLKLCYICCSISYLNFVLLFFVGKTFSGIYFNFFCYLVL